MKKIFAFFILLFTAGLALAAATPIDLSQAMHQSFNPPPTDYSVAYLSQIFGTVGNVLQGMSGQILGHIFAIFNKGVMVVAAIWLGYTTITIALRGAQEGSFMGQNRNVPVLLLRIALGFALMIPSSATGYSLLQDLFMKIVVQGVGLADYGWNAALNYIQIGGSLYIPPSTLGNDTGMITAAITGTGSAISSSTTLAPATQIFQDEVCMIQSEKWQKQMNANKPQTKSSGLFESVDSLVGLGSNHSVLDRKNGMIYFPGIGNSSSSDKITKYNAQCGYVTSYFAARPTATGYSDQQSQAMQTYSWQALEQLVNGLLPAAKLYVDKIYSSTYSDCTQNTTCASAQKEMDNEVFAAILGYANLITPYQKIVQNNAGNSDFGFIDTAKQEGWIMAGSFFWNIEQANRNSSAISISNLFPIAKAPLSFSNFRDLTPSPETLLSDAGTYVKNSAPDLTALWYLYVLTQMNAPAQLSPSHISTGNFVSDDLLNSAASQVGTLESDFILGGNSSFNPIVALMSEGNLMLNIAFGIWFAALVLSVTIGAIAGICQSTNPAATAFKGLLVWLKSVISAVCFALIVPGAILSYYVPMYPFIVFTFAAVGWIALVIEGMAAAPLVCMGLTHPENHDFLGQAQQALMLFLSIFVRPILMVIGLIVAMIVSFVAFKMLTMGFSVVFSGIATTTNANWDPLLQLFSILMMYVIFGFLTMEIIEQSYKLIYQLPNNVTQWIGGPQTGQDFGQMAAGLRGAISGAAGTTAKIAPAATNIATGVTQGAGAGGAAYKQYKDNKKANKVSGGATGEK